MIKKFAGRAYINPQSQIIARLLTRRQEEINEDFFYKRILAAWEYRKKIGYVEKLPPHFRRSR